MTFKQKKVRPQQPRFTPEQVLRLVGVIIIAGLLALGGLGLGSGNQNGVQPTPGPGTGTPFVFPAVPAGGTVLVADRTYFHGTGLYSLPHFAGFDLPTADAEEIVDATASGGTPRVNRVGATFINSAEFSVLHTFVEKNEDRLVKQVGDLSGYYDKDNLNQAWVNFTGGYKETNRRMIGDRYVIDFELYLGGNTYLARQTAQLTPENWIKVTRLVVPNNNPGLLDNLEAETWKGFTFYSALLNAPVAWKALADPAAGYIVRYPFTWEKTASQPGEPGIATGVINTWPLTLTTRAEPGKSAVTEQDARAWVAALRPASTVYNVQPETRGEAKGWTIAYNDPDPDGNSRSAVVTLLNGANGALYSANYLLTTRGLDLLRAANLPPELAQSRSTFTLLNTGGFVPTRTPFPTFTPVPATPTSAATQAQ